VFREDAKRTERRLLTPGMRADLDVGADPSGLDLV
jgi:hypothetical protein